MRLPPTILRGLAGCALLAGCLPADSGESGSDSAPPAILLPAPVGDGGMSVARSLSQRRSIRRFADASLSLQEVAQLLWAGGGRNIDGLTGATRTYPSAGGLYPIELYLAAGTVDGLSPGVYRYEWRSHALALVKAGRFVDSIGRATAAGAFAGPVPACIVATAVYSRTTAKYGERGRLRYVPMDMGGSGQSVFLQAVSLGLGTYVIGAFRDDALCLAIGAPPEETPLYIMPVGRL